MELNIITESTSAPLSISYADAGLFLWSSHEIEIRKQIKELDEKYSQNLEAYLKFKNELYDKFLKKIDKSLKVFREKLKDFNPNITMFVTEIYDRSKLHPNRGIVSITFVNELMFDRKRKYEYCDEEWEIMTVEERNKVCKDMSFSSNTGLDEYIEEELFELLSNEHIDKYRNLPLKDYNALVAKKEELLDIDKTVRANLEKQISDKAKREFMNNVNIASTENQIKKNPDLLKQIAEIAANVMNRMGAEGTKLIG